MLVRVMAPGSRRSISSATAASSCSAWAAVVLIVTIAEAGPLPEVVVLDLGDRDVELRQPVLQPAQHHALVLQRLGAGQEQLDRQQAPRPCQAAGSGEQALSGAQPDPDRLTASASAA